MAFGQNCTRRCGNIDVPYPFGIEPGCHLDGLGLSCNVTESKLYTGIIQVIDLDVLDGQATVYQPISWDCKKSYENPNVSFTMELTGTPYRVSGTRNRFTAIGCDTIALFVGATNQSYSTGCVSTCNQNTTFSNGSCSGNGCCQTSILPGLQYFNITLFSFTGHEANSWDNTCSFAFLVDDGRYTFRTPDLHEIDFFDRNGGQVPMVLDWSIGDVGCEEATKNSTSYACRSNNSSCLNATNGIGYLCNCSRGYQGNPYVEGGCEDINECDHPEKYPCHGLCTNLPGNYSCACPKGTRWDPLLSACESYSSSSNSKTIIIASVSVGGGSVLLLVATVALWRMVKRRTVQKRKEKFCQQNLELLRKEQSSSSDVALIERMKIYELEELEKATNHFDKTRIIGGGGHGHVFKGMLSDQRVVAIKRPNITNQVEIAQFVNEVFILSQTNHRNVNEDFIDELGKLNLIAYIGHFNGNHTLVGQDSFIDVAMASPADDSGFVEMIGGLFQLLQLIDLHPFDQSYIRRRRLFFS
ncbi:unnamed protein product [Musa acuminata subsp. malaccensis]|uniref:(wild Malaysian banana) hypothetical protein n=1 Tax=Musa acuminata subsp. malaccensis TaxID=214687 RepID=A0A804LA68_MUSAM|nr:unnamed protein product [Musa acuminata subsp. malaccensis]